MIHSLLLLNYKQCRIESIHLPLKATLPLLQRTHRPLVPTFWQFGSVVAAKIAKIAKRTAIFDFFYIINIALNIISNFGATGFIIGLFPAA